MKSWLLAVLRNSKMAAGKMNLVNQKTTICTGLYHQNKILELGRKSLYLLRAIRPEATLVESKILLKMCNGCLIKEGIEFDKVLLLKTEMENQRGTDDILLGKIQNY
jgi:hypothetical protein